MILDAFTYSIIAVVAVLAFVVIRLARSAQNNESENQIMICINCSDNGRATGNGVTLLDVTNVNEFHKGESSDAKNVALEDLPLLAQQYSNKDEPVVIYCGAYYRTIIAEKILRAMGFTDITNINSANKNRYCHQFY